MLIFAGDVDTSGNVDNAGFLPVFPPTNSNDTGKLSGKLKAMKSSPLLGPFCGSEFWGFSLLKI